MKHQDNLPAFLEPITTYQSSIDQINSELQELAIRFAERKKMLLALQDDIGRISDKIEAMKYKPKNVISLFKEQVSRESVPPTSAMRFSTQSTEISSKKWIR